MNKLLRAIADAILLGAMLAAVLALVAGFAQAQTQHTYTVPMLQDTVVVITNTSIHDAEVVYRFYDSMGIYIGWRSGDLHLHPQSTVAKWYCLPVGDDPWFSLELTSNAPLAMATYLDREIAQGYGCP